MSMSGRISNIWARARDIKLSQDALASGFGLLTITGKDPNATEAIDIVAIHGLNGHYEKTWTHPETGVFWLRDCIDIPNARVLSFSYNSTVQFSKSEADIFSFADQLLEGLLAARNSHDEECRPIIFICHSLGGVVFKQAFVRACEQDRYSILSSCMAGVLFFGTPHRGSDVASFAGIIGGLLKTGSLGSSTNTQLLKDLEPKSRVLENISRSFVAKCRSLTVISFYETEKMDFMKTLIVDRTSAIMGLPDEVAIPVDGTHRSICWFSRWDEPRFRPVSSNLKSLASQLTRRFYHQDQVAQATSLMRNLSKTNWRQHKQRNLEPVPGTCNWILQNAVYRGWLEHDASSLLWVSADPGCGKSMLASYLIDQNLGLDKQPNITKCYFFFKTDNSEQRNGVTGLQSLLRQLLEQHPRLTQSAAEHVRNQSLDDPDVLWLTFVKCARERSPAPAGAESTPPLTFCILDALDECDIGDRKKLARIISRSFFSADLGTEATGEKDGKSTGLLKVLVFSRPDNIIKANFAKTMTSTPSPRGAMIRLRGEDETDAISADVTRVVEATIADLINQELPEELMLDIKEQLILRADRTFLWVTLILQLLAAKVETGASRRELDAILQTRQIDAVYCELLSSRSDSVKARKVLGIILAAARPLTVSELGIAMAITPDHDATRTTRTGKLPRRPDNRTFSDLEYDLVRPFETHLKFICGNFIRIIRDKVYLAHETAREFLLESDSVDLPSPPSSGRKKWDKEHALRDLFGSDLDSDEGESSRLTIAAEAPSNPWQHSFSMPDCEALLLHICTSFLYMLAKRCDKAELGRPSKATQDFLNYAGTSWWTHFHVVRDRISRKDFRYYENLCHPRFPGFDAWTRTLVGVNLAQQYKAGRSEDEIQDLYTDMLSINADQPTESRTQAEIEDECREFMGLERQSYKRTAQSSVPNRMMQQLSSNPGSLSNHYFRLKVDNTGFVSLDFDGIKRKENPDHKQAGDIKRLDRLPALPENKRPDR